MSVTGKVERQGAPGPTLTTFDVVMLIVGIVVGAGIFALPSMVAAYAGDGRVFMLAWVLGGVISLAGALCYAELATTYPNTGAEYFYLRRAFGKKISFLFAWARLSIMQTGSIAIQAYIIGDYISRFYPLGEFSSAYYAALAVVLITAVNLSGIREGKRIQAIFSLLTVLSVVLIAASSFLSTSNPEASTLAHTAAAPSGEPQFGLAMVFVLLTFGGWNEAAYLSAELKDPRRSMTRALIYGTVAVTLLYLFVNYAYLRSLGLEGVAGSTAVAADLLQITLGPEFALVISGVVVLAALSTMNATAITGARTGFALGRDVSLLSPLHRWNSSRGTPQNALLLQAVVTLLLVFWGSFPRSGFAALVEYTAPVFWFFFLLIGLSLFRLRRLEPQRKRHFRVPLYPVTPLLFISACFYMFYASVVHTGAGVLIAVGVVLAGMPLLLKSKESEAKAERSEFERTTSLAAVPVYVPKEERYEAR